MANDTQNKASIVLLLLNGEELGRIVAGAIEPVEFYHETDVLLFLGLKAIARAA